MSGTIENDTHECQDCGMRFYNAHELLNHARKFCTNAGLHNLDGLLSYERKKGFSKKQSKPAYSMGSMKYEPVHSPTDLAKDAMEFERHREQLQANRQYKQADINMSNYSNIKRVPHFQGSGNIARDNASRVLGTSDISIKPLNQFYDLNSAQGQNKNSFMSPPSKWPGWDVKRNLGPSMLDKSNSSIARMSGEQKKDYATNKLLQLESISGLYNESGGMNREFKENMEKMKKFYKKILNEPQMPMGGNYPGQFVHSRAQTPISQLQALDDDTLPQRRANPGLDALDRQVQNKIPGSRQRNNRRHDGSMGQSHLMPSQFEGRHDEGMRQEGRNEGMRQEGRNEGMRQGDPSVQLHHPNGQHSNSYPAYTHPAPQIIMMPPYPQQQQQQSESISEQIRMLEKMIQIKSDENKELMKLAMNAKRSPDRDKAQSMVSQIRESRVSSMSKGLYHFETAMDKNQATPEEKILIALQREELDELRLLSQLPEELQKLKMNSVMRLIEQRTQLEKEILSQRVRRLEEQQKQQILDEQRNLQNDDWVSQERIRMINNQMGNYLVEYEKGLAGQEGDDDEDDYYPQQ